MGHGVEGFGGPSAATGSRPVTRASSIIKLPGKGNPGRFETFNKVFEIFSSSASSPAVLPAAAAGGFTAVAAATPNLPERKGCFENRG